MPDPSYQLKLGLDLCKGLKILKKKLIKKYFYGPKFRYYLVCIHFNASPNFKNSVANSKEIRGLCLMKRPSKMLQNFPPLISEEYTINTFKNSMPNKL